MMKTQTMLTEMVKASKKFNSNELIDKILVIYF